MPQRSLLIVLLAALLTAAAPIYLTAQTPPSAETKTQRLRIAELNCENLFDTLHTEGHDDHEFLPQAERRWNTRRYWHKLSMLAREIVSLSPMEPVDILALTEVESDTVLRDLTRRTRLSRLNYRYIITHGSDRRGINVALLYREGSLRPLTIKSICWQQRAGIAYPTRDALHVSGLLRSGDTANIIVCHLPSQQGKKKSRQLRSIIASALRSYTDSICAASTRPCIVIIGDMNTTPNSRTMQRDLGARMLSHGGGEGLALPLEGDMEGAPSLCNISNLRARPTSPRGTYRYRGHWDMLDQCVVSSDLLNPANSLHVAGSTPVSIVSHSFLMENDRQYGGQKPWRTFLGPIYHGGFSDHLPIMVEFEY